MEAEETRIDEEKALLERQAKAKREYDIENDVEWLKVEGIEGYNVYVSKDEMTFSYNLQYLRLLAILHHFQYHILF